MLLELRGPGQSFSFDEACAMLSDLETTMPPLNPYCLDELRTHLKDEPLASLQRTVRCRAASRALGSQAAAQLVC